LYNKYKDEAEGFQILAFPCNQFGNQEPGSAEQIRKFVEKYGVEFQMFEKIDVNGKNAHPVFVYLKSKQGGLLGDAIKWNFTKFLVDKNGQPIKRYGTATQPIPQIEKDVIEEMAK
jgi:glutathione peroxidase